VEGELQTLLEQRSARARRAEGRDKVSNDAARKLLRPSWLVELRGRGRRLGDEGGQLIVRPAGADVGDGVELSLMQHAERAGGESARDGGDAAVAKRERIGPQRNSHARLCVHAAEDDTARQAAESD